MRLLLINFSKSQFLPGKNLNTLSRLLHSLVGLYHQNWLICTQALPFAASASAAQSSAASGYQDSSYSLFSPKSYQENKKDTWRSSVFSPAVFDNASPCGIITVL